MIEFGSRDLYEQIARFDVIADIDLAFFDVAIGSREDIRRRERQGRGWQAHNHGTVASANRGDADIGDEILLLVADGHDFDDCAR